MTNFRGRADMNADIGFRTGESPVRAFHQKEAFMPCSMGRTMRKAARLGAAATIMAAALTAGASSAVAAPAHTGTAVVKATSTDGFYEGDEAYGDYDEAYDAFDDDVDF